MNTTFTLAEGLLIQQRQLKFWESILKPEIYNMLVKEADGANQRLPQTADGYDVWRGSTMTEYVSNIKL